MGEYTGVGLGVQTPDMMTKLSQLLTVKGQQAEVAGAQQTQRQRAALAKYDWNRHLGEDGTIDLNTLTDPELQKAAGDQYPDLVLRMTQAKTAQTESRRTLTALRNDQREAFAQMMNGLRSDKDVTEDNEKGRQKANEAMIQYGEMYGEDVLPVLRAYAKPLQSAPKGRLGDALRAVGLQAMSAGQQVAAQQPQYTSTGAQLTNVNPNAPGASPAAPTIPLTIGPGEQDTVSADQLGNLLRVQRTQRGDIAATAPLAGAARFDVGERHAFEAQAQSNFEAVTANRTAASMAPQQLDQINKALSLSKDVATGSWAQKRGSIESGLGGIIPGFDPAEDDATKLDLLNKFSERIAADASRVLGVNATTDAQRESISRQNANIGYTPKAIQEVLKYAKAQTMAMQAKGDAQENWLKEKGNGITKQHEFETTFRQAYDPRVFQFDVMSEKEQEEYLKTLSKEEKKSLKQKTQALIDLGAIDGG